MKNEFYFGGSNNYCSLLRNSKIRCVLLSQSSKLLLLVLIFCTSLEWKISIILHAFCVCTFYLGFTAPIPDHKLVFKNTYLTYAFKHVSQRDREYFPVTAYANGLQVKITVPGFTISLSFSDPVILESASG